MKTKQEYKKREKEIFIPVYNRFDLLFDHGKGAELFDEQGNAYLDLTSGIGVNVLGYANPALLEAQSEQLEKLTHTSNLFYARPVIEAADALISASGFSQLFFANSGAEANEGAIKTARKYAARNHGEKRDKILTLSGSFHGRTIATLEATGQDQFHHDFYPYTGGFLYAKANDIEDVKEKLSDEVAAIMFEVVQGESGVKPLDKEFVKEMEALAREKDVLILVDEVQSGLGRTGSLFAYEQYDIHPDLVTVAKGLGGGLPLGAFLINEKVKGTLQPGDHGSTFGGNLLSCASAKVVLDTISRPAFLDDVYRKGQKLKNGLKNLHKKDILDVRGLGLMIGVEVPQDKISDYMQKLMDHHLLVLKAGASTIRLLPPLIIEDEQIDKAIEIFEEVLE